MSVSEWVGISGGKITLAVARFHHPPYELNLFDFNARLSSRNGVVK